MLVGPLSCKYGLFLEKALVLPANSFSVHCLWFYFTFWKILHVSVSSLDPSKEHIHSVSLIYFCLQTTSKSHSLKEQLTVSHDSVGCLDLTDGWFLYSMWSFLGSLMCLPSVGNLAGPVKSKMASFTSLAVRTECRLGLDSPLYDLFIYSVRFCYGM